MINGVNDIEDRGTRDRGQEKRLANLDFPFQGNGVLENSGFLVWPQAPALALRLTAHSRWCGWGVGADLLRPKRMKDLLCAWVGSWLDRFYFGYSLISLSMSSARW